MAEHNQTGKAGEAIAKAYLQENKYEVLAINWRHRTAEIDLIAQKNNVVSIIEVKTRSSNAYGEPSIFVTKQKQKMMIQAAEWYCELNQLLNVEVSFDIISIVLRKDGTYTIEFIENAFYPTI